MRADWKPPEGLPQHLWENDRFALSDFRNLAIYLSRSMAREPEGDAVVRELLEKIDTKSDGALGSRQ